MIKLNLGCGNNILKGWKNHDSDLDIRLPLPYSDNSIKYIFIEHCIEHIMHHEALKFFKEAHRVLEENGIIRLAFPDVEKICNDYTQEYGNWIASKNFGNNNILGAVENITNNHGHMALWTANMMKVILQAIGFYCTDAEVSVSSSPELSNCEGHQKVIGWDNNLIETSIVEGTKIKK